MVPTDAMPWLAGLAVAGAMSLFGFLARRSLAQLEESVQRFGNKLDMLVAGHHAHGTAVALQEARLAALDSEMIDLRRVKHECLNTLSVHSLRLASVEEMLREVREDTDPRRRRP